MKKMLTFLFISVLIFNINAQNQIGGHEYVDLGLSVKWATCNIGASSPMEVGNYYAYGESFTKDDYTEDNYTVTKNGGKGSDAATVNWGNGWRMPTYDEMLELINKCYWEPIKDGVKITGPSGNSIVLPDAFSFDYMQMCIKNNATINNGRVEIIRPSDGRLIKQVPSSFYRTSQWNNRERLTDVLSFSATDKPRMSLEGFHSGIVVRAVHP